MSDFTQFRVIQSEFWEPFHNVIGKLFMSPLSSLKASA